MRKASTKYLECGIFAHGFARARCDDCGHDYFVAFSCQGRGVCPSCNTRRMVEGDHWAKLEGYQLLHRTAAPLLEARRLNASMAIMIVQSFDGDGDDESFNDFSRFCTLMEIDSVRNAVVQSKRKTEVPLLIGWVDCDPATDSQVAEASV